MTAPLAMSLSPQSRLSVSRPLPPVCTPLSLRIYLVLLRSRVVALASHLHGPRLIP